MTKEDKYMLVAIAALVLYLIYRDRKEKYQKKSASEKASEPESENGSSGTSGGGGSVAMPPFEPIQRHITDPHLPVDFNLNNDIGRDIADQTQPDIVENSINADAEKDKTLDKAVNTFTGGSDKIGLYTHVRKVTGKTFQI